MSIFGSISNVFEGLGDVILGPAGGGNRTRNVIGATTSIATGNPSYYTAARQTGMQNPVRQQAGGGANEVAISINQPGPVETSESSLGGVAGGGIARRQQPRRTLGPLSLPAQVGTAAGGALLGEAFDLVADMNITKFFGGGGVNICGQNGMKVPYSINARTGCLSISRKQQKVLKQMLMYADINQVASFVGLSTDELVALVTKQFPARRRGISASNLRNAKRVNNQILNMAHKLGYKTSPMSAKELSCR